LDIVNLEGDLAGRDTRRRRKGETVAENVTDCPNCEENSDALRKVVVLPSIPAEGVDTSPPNSAGSNPASPLTVATTQRRPALRTQPDLIPEPGTVMVPLLLKLPTPPHPTRNAPAVPKVEIQRTTLSIGHISGEADDLPGGYSPAQTAIVQ
jgi:hypothetical protein